MATDTRVPVQSLFQFDFELRTRVVFGEDALSRLGELARQLSFTRTLIVADPGIAATGYVERAAAALQAEHIAWFLFHDFDVNPDTRMVEAGRASAAWHCIDSIVAIGVGSESRQLLARDAKVAKALRQSARAPQFLEPHGQTIGGGPR